MLTTAERRAIRNNMDFCQKCINRLPDEAVVWQRRLDLLSQSLMEDRFLALRKEHMFHGSTGGHFYSPGSRWIAEHPDDPTL